MSYTKYATTSRPIYKIYIRVNREKQKERRKRDTRDDKKSREANHPRMKPPFSPPAFVIHSLTPYHAMHTHREHAEDVRTRLEYVGMSFLGCGY